MRVSYVTMVFPHPAEPFAASDVRALMGAGADVDVHSLRGRHPMTGALATSWGLGPVRLSHNSVRDSVAGLLALVRRPRLAVAGLRLVATSLGRPRQAASTLALLPRAAQVVRSIERDDPDVVHAFWGHYPAMVVAMVQRLRPDIVTSIFLGAYDLERSYPVSALAVRGADRVWSHAEINRGALLDLGASEDRIAIVHRGVDIGEFPTDVRKVEGRIVSIGRLIRSKGMDRVLESFALVARKRPDATLVVLGDGPERSTLESRARELGISSAVRFGGHVDRATVVDELAAAEAMVLLSTKAGERLPNAVKEAMACRCHCLVTRTPGIEELIPDQRYGTVLDDADPTRVAGELAAVLDDRAARDAVGRAARRRIEAAFDVDAAMRHYLGGWRTAVEARRRDA